MTLNRLVVGLLALALTAFAPPVAKARILDFLRRDSTSVPSAAEAPHKAFNPDDAARDVTADSAHGNV